jgi:hypothetical protein
MENAQVSIDVEPTASQLASLRMALYNRVVTRMRADVTAQGGTPVIVNEQPPEPDPSATL